MNIELFKFSVSSWVIFGNLCFSTNFISSWVALVAQKVKHLPAVQETWVRSLGQRDPLEKEMATHSSTLVWKIPWTEEPGRLQFMGSQRVSHDWATSLPFHLSYVWCSFYSSLRSQRLHLLSFLSSLKNFLCWGICVLTPNWERSTSRLSIVTLFI